MSCPAINDSGRNRDGQWSNTHSTCNGTPDPCPAGTTEVGQGTGSCGLFDAFTKRWRVCSKPYPQDANTLWDCCTGTRSQYNCDPSYCQNSQGCKNFFETNCSAPILFNNDNSGKYVTCNSWCNNNKNACNARKLQYCNNIANIGSAKCKEFAQALALDGNNSLDSVVSQFCTTHLNDPFCACQLKPPDYKGADSELLKLLNAPQCYDAKCISGGYESQSQISFRKSGSCPKSICSNKITIDNVKDSGIQNVIASCSATNDQNKPPAEPKPTAAPAAPAPNTLPNLLNDPPKLILFLFIMFVVVYMLFFPSSTGPKKIENIGGII